MTKITIESQIADFKQILTFNLVRSIDLYFDGDPEKFISAPYRFEKLKSDIRIKGSLPATIVKAVYEQISKYNKCAEGFDSNVRLIIFGNHKGGFADLIEDYLKTPSGTLQWTDKDGNQKQMKTLAQYSIPDDELRNIFKDKELHDKIIDLDSGLYTKRQKKIIYKYILAKREAQHTIMKDNKEYSSYKRECKIEAKKPVKNHTTKKYDNDDIPEQPNFMTKEEVLAWFKKLIENGYIGRGYIEPKSTAFKYILGEDDKRALLDHFRKNECKIQCLDEKVFIENKLKGIREIYRKLENGEFDLVIAGHIPDEETTEEAHSKSRALLANAYSLLHSQI